MEGPSGNRLVTNYTAVETNDAASSDAANISRQHTEAQFQSLSAPLRPDPTHQVLPKGLPDIDDISMTHLTRYIEHYIQDVWWSYTSDVLFSIGGIGYVILSIHDFREGQGRLSTSAATATLIRVIEYMAPLVYLLNSFVDIRWADHIHARGKFKEQLSESWNDWNTVMEGTPCPENPPIDIEEGTQPTMNTELQWYERLRRHTAHRRTKIAAWTFGIAAFCSVVATILLYQFSNRTSSDTWESASVHMYIVSGIVAVSGKRAKPWFSQFSMQNPETLEDMGDLLFLVGSFVDGVRCETRWDDANADAWAVMSAFMWLCDAFLYLRADVIFANHLRENGVPSGLAAGVLV